MKVRQIQTESDVLYLIKRRVSLKEKLKYRSNYVFELVSLEGLQGLDSRQDYKFMGAIPREIVVETKPVKDIEGLRDEARPDEIDLALYDEMLDVYLTTSEVEYKTRDGKKNRRPLLPTIENAWRKHFSRFERMERDGDHFFINKGDAWMLVCALGKIIHEEKLSDAFLKLVEEDVKWREEWKRPLLYTSKAQSLARRGFARYVPEWGNIRWTQKKYDSFNEFLDWVTELIDKYRIERQKENQPSLLLEIAYYIIEKKREEINYPRKLYEPKEEIQLKNIKSLFD
jgi:hypothetical protein